MTVYLSPIGNDQVVAASTGVPLVGGYWNVFLAGTSTPVVTYVDNAGVTQQPTNITLDAAGRPANPIWLSGGIPVKFRLFSATAVPLLTIDNVSGVNDPAGITAQDQWVLYGAAPTYISGTSFSLVGDQTGTFQIGRRVKTSNTGGTVYSTITNSVFGAVTTVTVSNDAGSLDSGLSAVSYGLISSINTSAPTNLARSGANTDITSLGPVARASLAAPASSMHNGTIVHSRAGSAETIAIKTLAGGDPSATDPVGIVFRNVTAGTGDYSVLTLTAATSITIPSTATMGCTNSVAFRLWLVAFNDAGTVRLGVIKPAAAGGIFPLAAWGIGSSTIMDTSSDNAQVFYTAAAVSSKAYAVLGYSSWESGLATVGTWGTAPTRVQLFGDGVSLPGDRVQLAYATSAGSSTSSTSYVDVTSASVSITLSSAANAVLSRATAHSTAPRVVSFNTGAYIQLMEASTVIDGNYLVGCGDNDGNENSDLSCSYGAYTYPNSASAVTYKLQHRGSNLGGGETITTDTCKLFVEELMA